MTEAQQLAERARVALLHDIRPIPPGVALDMVMDSTGDREQALTAIRRAMVRALRRDRPHGDTSPTFRSYALSGQRFLLAGNTAGAKNAVGVVRALARVRCESGTPAESDLGAAWLRWCSCADRYLAIARALTDAARPVETPA